MANDSNGMPAVDRIAQGEIGKDSDSENYGMPGEEGG
jgi:hypothetical protein